MWIFVLIFGLSFVALGFFVRKYPNLLAGYNTMTPEQKSNVDIEAVSRVFQRGFTVIGIITIAGYFLFKALGLTVVAETMLMAPLLIGILVLLALSQRYDRNKKSFFKRFGPWFLVGSLIFVVLTVIGSGYSHTKVILTDNNIEFTGQYGIVVPLSDIVKTEVLEEPLTINMRTNGFAFGGVCKGTFMLEGYGSCYLFLRNFTPPFLLIETVKGRRIIFNSDNPKYVRQLYNSIYNKTK